MTLCIVLILATTWAVYGNSLHNGFTNWDDQMVTENKTVRSLSPENLKRIFTPHRGATYQPVRMVSYAIDYHFWGLNPVGYHIHSIMLHGLAAVFLFLTLLRVLPQLRGWSKLTGHENPEPATRFIALLTALLFAVHPVNVEAVTWIAGRKFTLLAFFSFLAFYLFVRSSENDRYHPWRATGSVVCAVLAVLSSPFGVMLPGLFFLYDYCRDPSNNPFKVIRKRLVYLAPYLVFAGITLPFFLHLLVTGAGPGGADRTHLLGKPLYTLLTMIRVLFDYARNLIAPFWLSNRYPDYISISLFQPKVFFSACTLMGLAALVVLRVRTGHKLLLFCIGWFFIAWSPASNIIPISTKMADRYIYLAGAGFFMLFSVLLWHLKLSTACTRIKGLGTVLAAGLALVTIMGASTLTFERNKVWANSVTLWSDCIKKDPACWLAYNNLGNAMIELGKSDRSVEHYVKALELKPDYEMAHNNLGNALLEEGNLEEAAQHYRRAVNIAPDYAEAWFNLGTTRLTEGKYKEAIRHLRKALSLNSNLARAENNMGIAFFSQGRIEEAMLHYQRALEIDSEFADPHYNLGLGHLQKGENDRAVSSFFSALRIDPDFVDAHNNLGSLFLSLGKPVKALQHFKAALDKQPNSAPLHLNLANAMQAHGNLSEAARHFSEALRLNPELAEGAGVRQRLIRMYLQSAETFAAGGKLASAQREYEQILALEPGNQTALYNLAVIHLRQEKYDQALSLFEKSATHKIYAASAAYNMACIRARQGKEKEAVKWLNKALEVGYDNWDLIKKDEDLDNIRGTDGYQEILKRH